ncbi:MAG: c-type cytochrome domain-containing protein [Pirellulaceae bacterium]|jgi:WD40 repeat protein|nr:c-type cytochrome domain-containing protein [Pirellulaceae bacterium]MDP7016797.1 c-type cytochrome domain-containing protein [Pirellulaceae bacterium]
MKTQHLISSGVAAGLLICLSSIGHAEPVSFKRDIAPLLLDNCLACHGPKKAEGGYRVDSFERVVSDGDSGAAGFVPQKVDDSESYRRLLTDDDTERMPLDGDPLPADKIALIKKWIEEGASFDGGDPKLPLASIVPPPEHPAPPEAYPSTMPITAVLFSKDGKELYVGGYHEISVWNPADGKLVRRIKNVGQRTYALDQNADGSLLAVAGGAPGKHGEVRLFKPTGELVRVVGLSSDVALDVKFSPDGKRIAASSAESVVQVFAVDTGEKQLTITSHSDWVAAVAWSPDGSKLASASRDKTVKVFDTKTGELAVTYSGHGQPVKGVAFHPDGAEVFSGGGDKKIHRWKVADGKKSAEVGFGAEVYKLPMGGEFMFATSADKTVRQYEAKTHKEIRKYAGHQDWALSVAFHAGAKRVASGGFNGEVRIWNADDGAAVATFVAAPGLAKK